MARRPAAAVQAGASNMPGRITLESEYARQQIQDALALSTYAVSAGVRSSTGEVFAFDDIGAIQDTAARLGMFDPSAATRRPSSAGVTPAEWIAFEHAYYRLAVKLSPVTAETLAATDATNADGKISFSDRLLGYSPALRFTRWFSVTAMVVAAFVVISECRIAVLGQESDTSIFLWERKILESLLPWAYGALGSCAYLLRSAHYYIYQRSFDLRRKPEYFNRVLLGAISGGAIILFVNYLVDDGGTTLHLSSAALGFVAGYSTDFLFNTIERIVAAVFPKTDVDPNAQQRTKKSEAMMPPTKVGEEAAGTSGDGDGSDGGESGKPRKGARSKGAARPPAGQGNVKAGESG